MGGGVGIINFSSFKGNAGTLNIPSFINDGIRFNDDELSPKFITLFVVDISGFIDNDSDGGNRSILGCRGILVGVGSGEDGISQSYHVDPGVIPPIFLK